MRSLEIRERARIFREACDPYPSEAKAQFGLGAACVADPGLAEAINMHRGQVTNRAVAETFGLPFTPFAETGAA